jgi:maltose alpha-D-glucosyltransferase/alpha-amylase
LLAWFERMIHTVRESPEIGNGSCQPLEQVLPTGVLAHRADGDSGSMLFVHNLGTDAVTLDLSEMAADTNFPNQVFGDQDYEPVDDFSKLSLGPYGYRWIRLKRNPSY